jgi:ClpP class serine protease
MGSVSLLHPASSQFRNYPRAQRSQTAYNGVFDSADALVRNLVYGEAKLDPQQEDMVQLLGPQGRGQPLFDLLTKFDKNDLNVFTRVLREAPDWKTAQRVGRVGDCDEARPVLQDMDERTGCGISHTLADATGERLRLVGSSWCLQKLDGGLPGSDSRRGCCCRIWVGPDI